MCHLNIIIRKNDLDTENITPFLQHVSAHSFVQNSDADGLFMSHSGRTFKSSYKLDYGRWADTIEKSRVLISHQRISTSGMSKKNHQPLRNSEFVIAHNGVLGSYGGDKFSDTSMMFNEFQKKFDESKKDTREERIVDSIKKSLDGNMGSFSIILYDRSNGLCYYFKNDGTTINAYLGDFLYITTSHNNNVLYPYKTSDINLEEDFIYRIDGDLNIEKIGELESGYGSDWYNRNYGKQLTNSLTVIEEINQPKSISNRKGLFLFSYYDDADAEWLPCKEEEAIEFRGRGFTTKKYKEGYVHILSGKTSTTQKTKSPNPRDYLYEDEYEELKDWITLSYGKKNAINLSVATCLDMYLYQNKDLSFKDGRVDDKNAFDNDIDNEVEIFNFAPAPAKEELPVRECCNCGGNDNVKHYESTQSELCIDCAKLYLYE